MRNKQAIEYSMSKTMFDTIAKTRPEHVNPREYVMAVVNEEFGLRGTVTRIHIYED